MRWPRFDKVTALSEVSGPSPLSGKKAVHGALVTAVWTLVSRVLGFARDAVMLASFGATVATGNFVIAWMIPNLFRRLFGEGAVSAAVQPALARVEKSEGKEAARLLFSRFQGLLLLVLLGVLAVGELVVLLLLRQIPETASLSEPAAAAWEADREALHLTAWLLPYMVPICLTALAGAPQQYSGRFSLPALAPAALNAIWITWLWQLGDEPDIIQLPLGILIGGCVQWLMQWPGLRRDGWPLLPRWPRMEPELRATIRAFLPVMFGLAAIQVNLMIDQILVRELVSEDANSYTYAANRLLQLPMALVGVSAATGAMPLFARLAAERRRSELGDRLRQGSELTFALMIAAGGGLFVLAAPTIVVLFERGKFSAADSAALTPVLRAYLWSLPASAMIGLAARACQAWGDLRGPARVALASIPVNLGLDLLLLPRFGVAGAGYATAVALTTQLALLGLLLRKHGLGPMLRAPRLPRLLIPGIAATLAAAGVLAAAPDLVATPLGLACTILVGVLVATLAASLAVPELAQILRRKLGRRA